MPKRLQILTFLFFLTALTARSQNAPVSAIGIITDATPGEVSVPVTVTGFNNVGQFTLTITYYTSSITYISCTADPSFTGVTCSVTEGGGLGKLVINWPGAGTNFTLPDFTHLLDITFNYTTGTSYLSWNYSGINLCQYKTYSAGTYALLNHSPRSKYYKNGGVGDRAAPVTTATVVESVVPGNVSVPVTVTGFNTIGNFSLALEYDQSVLTFQNCTPNPDLSGTFEKGTQMGPNGKRMVTVSWLGYKTLPAGSTLFTISFTYSNANGSFSTLSWFDDGTSCEYVASGYKLIDMPTGVYYINGAIYSQLAPKVWLPRLENLTPNASVAFPVKTRDFTNISSFTLSFQYDTAAMSYNGFTPHPALSTGMTVVNNAPSGSKRKLVITWTGTGPNSLTDSSTIVNLDLTYKSAATALTWVTTDATSCRLNDNLGHPYYDLPKTVFYQDGFLALQVAPLTPAWQASPSAGEQVTLPVLVYNFSNIGLFNLTLDYNPGVLNFQGAVLVPSIGGSFTSTMINPGRISMGWTGTATSLADSSNLINLTFNYYGGSSSLAWYDNGNSCKYAPSAYDSALYDQPGILYYINGYIGPNPISVDFTAGNVTPSLNTTVTLNDNTTGGPTAWIWSISPETYVFVNGTNSGSQNPQVQFTSGGAYTITLYAFRESASNVKVRISYIHAGIQGLWTGNTSSDWQTASNWHNHLAPETGTNVLIPASAPNWPFVSGDFTLGTHCQQLTMEGSSQLTVDGDFTINTGAMLDVTGSATLILYGSWSNQGNFITGTGTVEFTGTEDAVIAGGVSPDIFYRINVTKEGSRLSLQGNIVLTGE